MIRTHLKIMFILLTPRKESRGFGKENALPNCKIHQNSVNILFPPPKCTTTPT